MRVSLMPLGASSFLDNAAVLPSSSSGNSLIQFPRDFIFPNNTNEYEAAILLGRLEEVDLDDFFTSDAEKPSNFISTTWSRIKNVAFERFGLSKIWPFAAKDVDKDTSRVAPDDSNKLTMVTLKDGSIVPIILAFTTTELLKKTLSKYNNREALSELIKACKDIRYKFPKSSRFVGMRPSKEILTEIGFLDDFGRVRDFIKSIVLNTVFEEEEDYFEFKFVDPIKRD